MIDWFFGWQAYLRVLDSCPTAATFDDTVLAENTPGYDACAHVEYTFRSTGTYWIMIEVPQ